MSKSKAKKPKDDGLVDIKPGELNFERAKVKLSMWVDGSIITAAKKKQLEVTGSEKGYQTLINQKLKEIFLQPDTKLANFELRLSLIEKLLAKHAD